MKIGVCFLNIGDVYKRRTHWSKINKQNYCAKHGYDFIDDESIYNPSKPIPWSKIPLLLKYINNYDYLVWIDADILIMNNKISIEHFIEKYNKFDMIVGSDWRMINTGIMIIKNTDFCKQFIHQIDINEYDPDEDKNDRYKNWEQGSFINLFDKNFLNCQEKIKVTTPTEFNSYWFNYFPGHFVLHLAGVRGDLLQYLIRDFYPERLDIDDDNSYNTRMEWLAGPIRKHFEEKLKHERRQEEIYLNNFTIDFINNDDFNNILKNNKHHLDKLKEIILSTGETLEGNIFYEHNTFKELDFFNKQVNLFSSARNKKHILEIGFNAGHSTLLFLLASPDSIVYCFDICEHKYTEKCFEYISSQFPNRIKLFKGDSRKTIPDFTTENNNNIIFDVIHIDGSHDFNIANCDFFNTLKLVKYKSILIFDDTDLPHIKFLWDGYVKDKHIKQLDILPVKTHKHFIGYYLKE
jgi:predicted O-methyltransferase YrrM